MAIELYGYQEPLVDKVLENIRNKSVVLAAAPGAGKTEMSFEIIKRLRKDRQIRVLILAHATTILRSQFAARIARVFGEENCQSITSLDEFNGAPITVAIPQAFKSWKTVPKAMQKIDLLIVDEAHEFYFAKKYGKQLREKLKPKMQLLLTGTHFKFTRENNLAKDLGKEEPYCIVPITMNEIIEQAPNQIANLRVLACQSCYNFTEEDYNDQGDLREGYKFVQQDTEKTLEKVVRAVLRHVQPSGSAVISLKKSLFACHNIKQAYMVYNWLVNQGYKTVISVSEEERGKEHIAVEHGVDQIDKFKADPNLQALVVVNRAVLGYNHPELTNVIDLSGTRNIARIYQLLCRAVRAYPNENQRNDEKLFIKVGPYGSGGYEYTLHILSAVLQLNDTKWFTQFDGRNFLHLPIPTLSRHEKTKKKAGSKGSRGSKKTNVKMYLDVVESRVFFDGVRDTVLNNPAAKVGTTTLGKVREALLGIDYRRPIVNIAEEHLKYILKTREIHEGIYG